MIRNFVAQFSVISAFVGCMISKMQVSCDSQRHALCCDMYLVVGSIVTRVVCRKIGGQFVVQRLTHTHRSETASYALLCEAFVTLTPRTPVFSFVCKENAPLARSFVSFDDILSVSTTRFYFVLSTVHSNLRHLLPYFN